MSEQVEIGKEVEDWLKKPLENSVEEASEKAKQLIAGLQKLMQSDAADKKIIGSLIGRVKSTEKNLQSLEPADWVKFFDGHLAIGHRPSAKLVADLKLQNTTHLLTLLSESEGSGDIKSLCKKFDLGWLWFPMKSAGSPAQERWQELVDLFKEMESILKDGGKIYVHCSAGIHRTGMITFAFLRFIGLSIEEAETKLTELRPTTSEDVGEDRMEWGSSVLSQLKSLD
ncbi:MAG: dual specificity protein phosphatase family protein [Cytophagia bacterium]|nr:dual specificity protein phosphatase family protein [Cytophagia bacterium]